MDAALPRQPERLIAFAGDTGAADKVKDKPSVGGGAASPAGMRTQIHAGRKLASCL